MSGQILKTGIMALTARGLRGGLDAEDSHKLCELVLQAEVTRERGLIAATKIVEEMKDCGGVTDEQILELHGLLISMTAE